MKIMCVHNSIWERGLVSYIIHKLAILLDAGAGFLQVSASTLLTASPVAT
jgi:hypothetical protein